MTNKTVLVADDEADLRMLVRTALSRACGCAVVEAADGAEAVAAYRSGTVDVAVLDQRMPELTGLEVARAIRADGFAGPIFLFSAYLDPEIEEAAVGDGLVTVPKGNMRALVDAVRDALG